MAPRNKTEKGKQGEDLAASYLEAKGYIVMDRNYFFERSEVDMVASDGSEIVFVEVKFRTTTEFGEPEDSVTEDKIKHIAKAAEAWIYERRMDGYPVRFDVIAIVQQGQQAPDIKHFEDAFRPGIS